MIQIKAAVLPQRKLIQSVEVGMIGYVEAPQAWGLTRGMARTLGLDLVAAVTEGWLSRAELGDLVGTCACCDRGEACTAWLAVTLRSPALPDFCRNALALGALQP